MLVFFFHCVSVLFQVTSSSTWNSYLPGFSFSRNVKCESTNLSVLRSVGVVRSFNCAQVSQGRSHRTPVCNLSWVFDSDKMTESSVLTIVIFRHRIRCNTATISDPEQLYILFNPACHIIRLTYQSQWKDWWVCLIIFCIDWSWLFCSDLCSAFRSAAARYWCFSWCVLSLCIFFPSAMRVSSNDDFKH